MDWTAVAAIAAVAGAAGTVVPLFLWWLDRKRNNPDVARLTIEGADWVERKKIGYNRLLAALISLDRAALPDLTDLTGGTVDKKANVFKKSPETWALVVYNDSMIVGYWSCFSLSDPLLKKLLDGNMYDSEIVSSAVKSLSDSGPHHLYFEMVGIHPGFRWCEHYIRNLLYESLHRFAESISNPQSEVRGLYANGFSEDGKALCHWIGMKPIVRSVQGGEIYSSADVSATTKKLWARLIRSRIVAAARR